MNSKNRWPFLDRLVAKSVFVQPSAIYAELAETLRESIQDRDSESLRAIAGRLSEIVQSAMRFASAEARLAAQGKSVETSSAAAESFALGRLGFAYQIAASVADRLSSTEFEQTITSPTYAPYLRALLDEDLAGTSLAELLGQRVETVSRNLKKLREVGAVDYRREQTSFINFLTPAARHLLEDGEMPRLRSRLAAPVREWVRSEAREMPPVMREVQNFAHELERDSKNREKTFADD